MKYEVIGWEDCDNSYYPKHSPITAPVDAAVIKEIRKHGYSFGGDLHEMYSPVLNDGTVAVYSWRSWGAVMAEAHKHKGDMAYSDYYMDMLVDKGEHHTPSGDTKDGLIVPKEALSEVFVMHLSDDMFEALKNGTKTIEVRLFDDKRKKVDVGDYIEFRKSSDESQFVIRKVADLKLAETFKSLLSYSENIFEMDDKNLKLTYSPLSLGMKENANLGEIMERIHSYYDKAQEKKFGAIAFRLEKPKHYCATYFGVWKKSELRIELYRRTMDAQNSTDEEIEKILWDDERCDENAALHNYLEKLNENYQWYYDWFRFGYNDSYDPDVNVMIRKTLGRFMDDPKTLKKVQQTACLPMTLEIVVTVIKDSEEPKQNLNIDSDILEFLEKSGVELKLNKRVI